MPLLERSMRIGVFTFALLYLASFWTIVQGRHLFTLFRI